MAFICVSTSSKSLTGPQNQPGPSGPDVTPPTPPPTPTTITVAPTLDLVSLFRNPAIGYQANDTTSNNTAVLFNPRNYPFGATFLHYDWTYLEATQGVYTFNGEVLSTANLLKDLDNAWANGAVAIVKVLENDPASSIDGPPYLSAIAGWTADYSGTTVHFADFSNASVRTALGNFLQALYAAIGTHPAFGGIDAGWGAYQENTYSGAVMLTKINTTVGTIGAEIPSLTNTVATQYYDVWTTYIPAAKMLCFVEDQYSWDYCAGTKHTGGRTDSFGYEAPIAVQCTDSATSATYGGQFMCKKNAQTFAAVQIVPTAYTPSQPNAYLSGMMSAELWSFYYRTFGAGGSGGTVTADAGTDFFTVSVTHNLLNTYEVRFYSIGGAVPAPLVEGTTYYIVNKTATTFQVALTSGGAAVNLTTAGTGTIHCLGYNTTDATGPNASKRWEGANWDFASSFQFAIDNHISTINAKNAFRPKSTWLAATDNLLRSIGYRYQLRSFSFPNLATAGSPITFASTWRNVGNAPNYRNTVIGYRLKNASTNQMFYLTNYTALNHRPYSLVGDVPITEPVTIPTYIDDGSYEISVGGMDPTRKVGELKLAITSPPDDGSRWYPMGVISIANSFTVLPALPTTYSAHFTGVNTKYGTMTDRESMHLSHNIKHVFTAGTTQNDFSIFMRVKTNSISATQALFTKGDVTAASTFEWGVFYSNALSGLRVVVSDGTNLQGATWSSNAVVGTTYNIYMEYDSTTRVASISVDNGAAVTATALAANVTLITGATGAVRLGADTSASKRPATADIKYVYAWKKKRSAAAQTRLHNSAAGLPLSDFNDDDKDQLYCAYNFTNQNLNDEWNINHFTNTGGVTFV